MKYWNRFFYQPCLPIGKNGTRITESKEHIELSRNAATEGMVLLKNENQVLPIKAGTRVAIFGKGATDYVKGGGGSGDVTVSYIRNLVQGMEEKEKEGKVELYRPLNDFYKEEVAKQYAQGYEPGMVKEPALCKELLEGAKRFTDTAIICISRFSGENWDRTVQGQKMDPELEAMQKGEQGILKRSSELFQYGDFYLSDEEQLMVDEVKMNFANVIVVLNVGGVVDTNWFYDDDLIDGALLGWQGGMEGGLAMADILVGDVNPSGKLVDTFAKELSDYPSTEHFHDSIYYVEYNEDIYLGYRYFESMPGAAEKVNYPFGYGLSYTEFLLEEKSSEKIGDTYVARILVTNVGEVAGKEVVQMYVSAPQGLLGKPKYELKAFAKTKCLQPGESQLLTLKADEYAISSYDDCGKVCKSAYVMEKGTYTFYYGNQIRNLTKLSGEIVLEADLVTEQLSEKCAPNMLHERMKADGTYETMELHPEKVRISDWDGEATPLKNPDRRAMKGIVPWAPRGEEIFLSDVADQTATMDELLAQLEIPELIELLCGQINTGVANTYGFGNNEKHEIPNVMTADGPAGLRIQPQCGVNTTAFPCATLLACSWNEKLVEEIGKAGALEVKENNIGVWLTPAMCIHRSPLCGRNFEYYSEDPLISGKMGAAKVRGIQSQKIAASVKHFACNNKETLRFESDSRVSERALREIYLKGFEIVVREADPWTIMSSYNVVNGQRDSENKDLLTGILRDEWGFAGMVTTDWWNHAEQYIEIKAGNDVKMGCGYPERLQKDVEEGRITREELEVSVRRVLEMILKLR